MILYILGLIIAIKVIFFSKLSSEGFLDKSQLDSYKNALKEISDHNIYSGGLKCSGVEDYTKNFNKYLESVNSPYKNKTYAEHAYKFIKTRSTPTNIENLNKYEKQLIAFYNGCLLNISNNVSKTDKTFNGDFKNHI